MRKSGKAPFIPDQDLQQTLNHQEGKNATRNRAIILASHFMGLRAKEIASLKVGDLYDFKKQELKDTIRLLAAYTKGAKYREVFLLDGTARKIITEYLDARQDLTPSDPLFRSQKGGAFSANTMQRMIGNLYKKAGINGSSHSGRRSFATRLIRSNVDIYSVQQLLGHSSIATTQEYFSSDPHLLKLQVSKISQ